METYSQIPDYEYEVSDFGSIRNKQTQRVMKQSTDTGGYRRVGLRKDKKQTFFLVHRLVCFAFKSNSENKECVDHIDGNRQNNHISNLRWCSYSENLRNRPTPKNNKSGIKGVHWVGKTSKWRAQKASGQYVFFDNKEEARLCRITLVRDLFGEFAHPSEKTP